MKDKQVAVRFTVQEWAWLQKLAEKYEMNVSELIRNLARQMFKEEKLYK